jgi:hypothetical protein
MLGQPIHHWPQVECGLADPVSQHRAVQIKARPRQDLALAIQGKVVRILADQHMGEGRLGWQPSPMIRWLGAGAWVTPSVQVRQAYFGRTVTITRNWAGTMSKRSLRSSPILCMTPQPQGQIRLVRQPEWITHDHPRQFGRPESRSDGSLKHNNRS